MSSDKRESLERVQNALGKGDKKGAVEELERHINEHPDDVDARLRLSRMLADEGDLERAWDWTVSAASGFAHRGFLDKAIALLHRATEIDPTRPEPALLVAEYQIKRGHTADARKELVDARKRFHRRRDRDKALLIAERRVQLVPDVDGYLDVTLLMTQLGRGRQAVLVLDDACTRPEFAKDRRRILRRRFFIKPTPLAFWRWLRG